MLSATTEFDDSVRVRATTLADATRRSAALRATSRGNRVLLDVEVFIASDASAAFTALAAAGESADAGDQIRYVGTPRGLASLIADVATLGIADGVVLKPLAGCPVTDLMLEALVPGLTSGSSAAASAVA